MAKPRNPTSKGADAIAAAVALDIGSGQLGNGAWLKQIDIETRYRCTRADARRALEALAIRGQIQRIPLRGYFVSVVDEGQRRELVEVRVLLETAMVPSIVERATRKDIVDLRRLVTAFAAAARQGDVKERYMTNRAFHVRLTGLCANRELAKLALAVRGDLPTTPIAQWHSQARIEQSAREHAQIVDALANRDVRKMTDLIAVHIRQPSAPTTTRARAAAGRG
jgi:DNA-binding GntR family transcriptional regulator